MNYERIIIDGIPVFLGPSATEAGTAAAASPATAAQQAPAEGGPTSRPVFTWDTATTPVRIGRTVAGPGGTTVLELDADWRERCAPNLTSWRQTQAARPRGQLRVRGDNPKPKIKKSRASA
jgi:hypothetical protein